MSYLEELLELFKEYSDLGPEGQEHLLAVALEEEDAATKPVKVMEASLTFVNRVQRFFDEVEAEDVTLDLEEVARNIERAFEEDAEGLDPDEVDLNDEE